MTSLSKPSFAQITTYGRHKTERPPHLIDFCANYFRQHMFTHNPNSKKQKVDQNNNNTNQKHRNDKMEIDSTEEEKESHCSPRGRVRVRIRICHSSGRVHVVQGWLRQLQIQLPSGQQGV